MGFEAYRGRAQLRRMSNGVEQRGRARYPVRLSRRGRRTPLTRSLSRSARWLAGARGAALEHSIAPYGFAIRPTPPTLLHQKPVGGTRARAPGVPPRKRIRSGARSMGARYASASEPGRAAKERSV